MRQFFTHGFPFVIVNTKYIKWRFTSNDPTKLYDKELYELIPIVRAKHNNKFKVRPDTVKINSEIFLGNKNESNVLCNPVKWVFGFIDIPGAFEKIQAWKLNL